jgi:uncharacterized protein YjdB
MGEDLQLQATMHDRFGAQLSGRLASWASADCTVATVSPAGLVTALSEGQTEISVTSGGRTAVVGIKVTAPTISAVRVSPSETVLGVGGGVPLSARALNARGRVLAGLPVSWASSDPSVAMVSDSGVVTGLRMGSVKIAATVAGRRAVATVTVNPTGRPR